MAEYETTDNKMIKDEATTARERMKRELFEGAISLESLRRREYLEERAGGDHDLLDSVLRLLEAEATTDSGILDFSPHRRRQIEPRATPMMFGPYRVIRPVGEGGMGKVFACQKDGDTDLVAAKVIRSVLPLNEFRDAFEKEREILITLRHPNIGYLIDGGVANGEPFFIMEYVEGEPIDVFCRRRRLTAAGRLLLVVDVLTALDYLHLQNVIHRDLKPSNILVTVDGAVKILDFGIAKIASHTSGMTGLGPTSSRNSAMTIRYASPEQLKHTRSGRSSDLYALGVIAYELLTGCHPYWRELKKGVAHFIQAQSAGRPTAASGATDPEDESGLPNRLRELPILFRGSVDQLLFNALAAETSRRYRTATQFLLDVRRCLDNKVVAPLRPASS